MHDQKSNGGGGHGVNEGGGDAPPQNSHSHATADVINGNDVRGLKKIPDVSFRNGLSDSTGDGVWVGWGGGRNANLVKS